MISAFTPDLFHILCQGWFVDDSNALHLLQVLFIIMIDQPRSSGIVITEAETSVPAHTISP